MKIDIDDVLPKDHTGDGLPVIKTGDLLRATGASQAHRFPDLDLYSNFQCRMDCANVT